MESTTPNARIQRQQRRRMRRLKRTIFVSFLAVLIGLAAYFGYYFNSMLKGIHANPVISEGQTETTPAVPEEKVNILLIGVDVNYAKDGSTIMENTRSDTMILASIDPKTKEVNLVSIPRDTRVPIPGYPPQKINAAHALGGIPLTIRTVREFLGVPIHHYVRLNYKGFREIVDAVGGVEVDVEKEMNYDDNAGNLHIHLSPGLQLLDGEKAEQYVRFRHDGGGDLGRIPRQQKFMEALARKILQPGSLFQLPRLAKTIPQFVETDMTGGEIMGLAALAAQIKPENIKMATIPGTPDTSDYLPDETALKAMVDELLRDDSYQVNAAIKITVLNGSGVAGGAGRVADMLRLEGFQVGTVGNADRFDYPYTEIRYRGEDVKETARRISVLLTGAKIVQVDNLPHDEQIVVIVGQNNSAG